MVMGRRGTGRPIKQRDKWRIRWLDEHGERHSAVFEKYNEAVSALHEHERTVRQIARGDRPSLPADRAFSDLCDLWLAKRASRKRSKKDDASIIRKHLRPRLGRFKVRALATSTDPIEDMTDELLDVLSEKTVANILTLLISMLRYAEEKNWIIKAPKIRKPKIVLFDTDYRYLRSESEIRRFLDAARLEAAPVRAGAHVHALFATAVYTGMRAGELAAMAWDDVNLERRLIRVQRSFRGPTKSKDMRWVPILDPLLPILREWRLRCPSRIVFPSERGTMQLPSARVFQDVLHRVLDEAEFPKIERNGREVRYITFHCLRHTFASSWAMNGGSLAKLQKILGHKSPQMTQRYAHLAPEAFADDYGRLGAAAPNTPVVGRLQGRG